jgi:hypothetical protein
MSARCATHGVEHILGKVVRMHYLLVQPRFPIPSKSLNHSSYLPVGLLKLSTWLKSKGNDVTLVTGNVEPETPPDAIYITSLFTYWADTVRDVTATV